jgi:hypothetical protein
MRPGALRRKENATFLADYFPASSIFAMCAVTEHRFETMHRTDAAQQPGAVVGEVAASGPRWTDGGRSRGLIVRTDQ